MSYIVGKSCYWLGVGSAILLPSLGGIVEMARGSRLIHGSDT